MGELTSGGTGSFEVHMDNTETVGTISFEIADVPEYLTVTSVEALDRFSNGVIDGSSGEDFLEEYKGPDRSQLEINFGRLKKNMEID